MGGGGEIDWGGEGRLIREGREERLIGGDGGEIDWGGGEGGEKDVCELQSEAT